MKSLLDELWEKGLTKTEINVACYMAVPYTIKQMADLLCVTEKSVQWHISSVYKKLGFKTRSPYLIWARRRRLPDFVFRPRSQINSEKNAG